MRIIGQGIDLIETQRIAAIWRDHPERFLGRVLTEAERAYCQRRKFPLPHIAGRFAAKEAILKALGTGWRGQIAWTDMEILNDEAGRPSVVLGGKTLEIAQSLGVARMLISITHTEHYAAAAAIAVGN
jgi:holo-[acyl-carrier protein] synthase